MAPSLPRAPARPRAARWSISSHTYRSSSVCGPQLAVNLLAEENDFATETACNLQQSDIRSFFLLGSIPISFSFLVLGQIVEIANQVESFSVCIQSLSILRHSTFFMVQLYWEPWIKVMLGKELPQLQKYLVATLLILEILLLPVSLYFFQVLNIVNKGFKWERLKKWVSHLGPWWVLCF